MAIRATMNATSSIFLISSSLLQWKRLAILYLSPSFACSRSLCVSLSFVAGMLCVSVIVVLDELQEDVQSDRRHSLVQGNSTGAVRFICPSPFVFTRIQTTTQRGDINGPLSIWTHFQPQFGKLCDRADNLPRVCQTSCTSQHNQKSELMTKG